MKVDYPHRAPLPYILAKLLNHGYPFGGLAPVSWTPPHRGAIGVGHGRSTTATDVHRGIQGRGGAARARRGKTVAAAARSLDLTESALRQWVRDAERDARRTGMLSSGERKELEQLRRENRTLRMERDILKKAAAFFAKDHA